MSNLAATYERYRMIGQEALQAWMTSVESMSTFGDLSKWTDEKKHIFDTYFPQLSSKCDDN